MTRVPGHPCLRSIVVRGEPLVVCVHPVTGEPDSYDMMARSCRGSASFYSLLRGSNAREKFSETSARVALTLRDTGAPRLVLLGSSTGGMLAADICAELEHHGILVERLVVIEGRVTVPEMSTRLPTLASVGRQVVRILCERAGIAFPVDDEFDGYEFSRSQGLIASDMSRARYDHWVGCVLEAAHAYMTHQPRPLAAPVSVLVSTDDLSDHPRPPSLGWEQLSGSVEHLAVPGNHFSVLAPRFAAQLAAVVDSCLTRQCSERETA